MVESKMNLKTIELLASIEISLRQNYTQNQNIYKLEETTGHSTFISPKLCFLPLEDFLLIFELLAASVETFQHILFLWGDAISQRKPMLRPNL